MALKKIKEPEILETMPWQFDPLERERDGLILTQLIQSLNGPYVIAVKARWGSGKSVFLKRLTNHLESKGVPVISVNAWRNDYLADPMISFLAAIRDRLEADKGVSGKVSELLSDLAKHGSKLIVPMTSVIAGCFLPGAGELVKASSEAVEKIGSHLLDWEKEQRSSENEFRKRLEEARDLLTKNRDKSTLKPIVIAIDELDRCKPDFSIKVLERIKHYFDVDGIIFLIATDGKNLPDAVASIYGQGIDGEIYLRKFFDYEYQLQDPPAEKFINVLSDQFDFDSILKQGGISLEKITSNYFNAGQSEYDEMVERCDRSLDALEILMAFPSISRLFNMTLRDQAQAFTVLNAHLRTISKDMVIFPQALVFSVCLRFYKNEYYEKIMRGTQSLSEVLNEIRQSDLRLAYDIFSKEHVGIDISLFANAESHSESRAYSNQLMNASDKPAHAIRAARYRVCSRINYCKYRKLSDYLKRSMTLADAFS